MRKRQKVLSDRESSEGAEERFSWKEARFSQDSLEVDEVYEETYGSKEMGSESLSPNRTEMMVEPKIEGVKEKMPRSDIDEVLKLFQMTLEAMSMCWKFSSTHITL